MTEMLQAPARLELLADNIPQELKGLPQWVGWRWTQNGNKWDKPPLNIRTGRHASSTDSSTWSEFDAALAAYQDQDLDGVGFVFTADDEFVGIDLDNCRDPDTGLILPWKRAHRRWRGDAPNPQEIIDGLDSYSEISPSGTGVKIIVAGQIPKSGKAGDFEMYDHGRYFTITGHRIANTPAVIRALP